MSIIWDISGREFVMKYAADEAFTTVSRYVLSGPNHSSPSNKLNSAYIACGTRGIGVNALPNRRLLW